MSDFSSSLLPESADVEQIKKILGNLGWEKGDKYGLMENMLLDNYVFDVVFDERFNHINESLLRDLDEVQCSEVLDHVKNVLRNASEDSLLDYLKYGVEYTVKRSEKRIFRLIDFSNPENNSFVYGWEIKFPGSPRNIKPDFTLFVNGIPIAIIEVKPSTRIESEQEAIDQIRRYEQESPEFFRYCQLGIAYGDKKLFLPTYPNWSGENRLIPAQPWKIEQKIGNRIVKVENIEHLLSPHILLDILRWYTFYRDKDGSIDKIIARYNQFSATEEAVRRIYDYLNRGGNFNRGLVWHWQGSGKTYTMFYIANRFFEEYFDRDPLVFFVVDRRDLQRQLRNFIDALKAPKFKGYLKIIESIDDLKKEITTIKRSEYLQNIVKRQIYIVLIQKFQVKDFENLLVDLGEEYLAHLRETDKQAYEEITMELNGLSLEERRKRLMELGGIKKREILLLIDEAHRSQYGLLASMMKNVMPNAFRIAFTGTPVFKFERNTFVEFAYPPKEFYMDVYFIRDSIEDNFTLPLVYDVIQEGRVDREGIRILLQDEEIKDYIEAWVEASQEGSVADDVETYLETGEMEEISPRSPVITRGEIRRNLSKIRVFLTNERRLEKLARHIAERIKDDTENFRFKAMVVAANREACVHMKRFLDRELQRLYGEEAKDWTEIVMSYQHNDRGIILTYKEELIKRWGKSDTNEINMDIQRKFKEGENPKILVVTDMLITGFDAPILKVMYLDKPLYEHRLLQAIARVNRPYKDDVVEKKYGLIVDSVGLLKHVKESLRKFELIADKRIASDVEENVLGSIEQKVEELKKNLNDMKGFLNQFSIEGINLNINVDEIKVEMKKDKKKALEMLEDTIIPKTKIIAAFWDRPETQILLTKLKDTICLYKALGSHREKIHYRNDIQILSYIYGKILYYIRGRKVPREFWDGLIELIHEKTLVDDFYTLVRTEINNEMMKRIMRNIRGKMSAQKIISEPEVADAYRILKILLEMDLANPLYKVIRERIERAREDWINRNIDTPTFIKILENAMEEKLKFDEEIAKKPVEDRIIDTVNMLINQRFGKDKVLKFEFTNLREAIQVVLGAAKVVATHGKRIRTALLKDLFRGLKRDLGDISGIIIELRNLSETITEEYIIPEIEKAKMRGAYAA